MAEKKDKKVNVPDLKPNKDAKGGVIAGPGENGPGQHGPGQHGPGQHGPGQHGPGQHGGIIHRVLRIIKGMDVQIDLNPLLVRIRARNHPRIRFESLLANAPISFSVGWFRVPPLSGNPADVSWPRERGIDYERAQK